MAAVSASNTATNQMVELSFLLELEQISQVGRTLRNDRDGDMVILYLIFSAYERKKSEQTNIT